MQDTSIRLANDLPNSLLCVIVEHDFPEQTRRSVVHVDNDMLETSDSLECPLDQIGPRWGEDLLFALASDPGSASASNG
jgi:hypothetical protein